MSFAKQLLQVGSYVITITELSPVGHALSDTADAIPVIPNWNCRDMLR